MLMILNIVLTLYVVVCLFCCLFLRARNKKALCHSQTEGRRYTQDSKRGGIADGNGSFFTPDTSGGDGGCGGVVVTLVADVGVVVIDAVRRRPLVGSYRHW